MLKCSQSLLQIDERAGSDMSTLIKVAMKAAQERRKEEREQAKALRPTRNETYVQG